MKEQTKRTKIDSLRLFVLTAAELFDAWRVIPRLLVVAYGWLCWEIVAWYMTLEPVVIDNCNIELLGELCINNAPTTQHAALVTVVIGAAAAVFGFYTNTGRSWTSKFIKWDDTNTQLSENKKPPTSKDIGGGFNDIDNFNDLDDLNELNFDDLYDVDKPQTRKQ